MISIQNLSMVYHPDVTALDDISLEIESGKFIALQGPSGSGKSTLLSTLSGLVKPTSGSVKIDGTSLYEISPAQRSILRAEHIGMIFQNFHLLPYLNVLENITLPSVAKNLPLDHYAGEAKTLIEQLDLGHRINHHPAKLSAGECQRVAFARAIISQPKLLLADEPTGNLDNKNTTILLGLLRDYANKGNTVIMVTHADTDAQQADQIINITNGKLLS